MDENPYRSPLSPGGAEVSDSAPRSILPRVPKPIRLFAWFGLLVLGASTSLYGLSGIGLSVAMVVGLLRNGTWQVALVLMAFGIVMSSLGGFLTIRAFKRLWEMAFDPQLATEKEAE